MSVKIKEFTCIFLLLVILTQSSNFQRVGADDPAVIAEDWHEYINNIPDGSAILFPLWYDPSNMNELFPMTLAVMYQLFQKDVKVIIVTFQAEGTNVINQALGEIYPQNYDKIYGVDWVNLGYIAGSEVAVYSLANNLSFTSFDAYGTPLDQLSIMQSVNSASDISLVIIISDKSLGVETFLRQWNAGYNVPIICGCTSALYPEIVPYYTAGMLSALLYGLSSVAEYEILIGFPTFVTITSPNGGENWVSGTTHTIIWTSTGSPKAYVKIELLKAGVLNRILASSTLNDGSYDWAIPMTQPLGSDYIVKITRTTYPTGSTRDTDSSNGYFSLIPETLTVTSPNGGESWVSGTAQTITWESTGSPKAYVKIELVKPGVANKVLISSTPNDGSYTWVIPMTQPLGSDYTVKITRTTYPAGGKPANDTSEAYFSVIPEELTVKSPNGEEEWVSGTAQTITWESTGSPKAYVRIELLKAGVLNRVLTSSTPNDGSYDWAIPMTQPLGTDYSVRITRTTYPPGSAPANDTSNSYFSIVAETLTVTSPIGAEDWVSGTTNPITWTSTGNPKAYVRIELLKAGVLNRVLSSSTLNDGSFDCVIPLTQALGADYSVKITRTTFSTGSTAATDTSDGYFSLIPETLTIISPNGGESWVSGTAQTITWESTGSPKAYVRIELLKAGALNKVISSSTPNDGSYTWVMPMTQPLGSDYTVKITRTTFSTGSTAATDTSDTYFAIISEVVMVSNPIGGEDWVSGTTHAITWRFSGNPTAFVKIELLKAGLLKSVISSSTINDGWFDWTIPLIMPLGSDYMVRITRTTYPTGSAPATDSSDTNFSIIGESLTVTSPNGGESWVRGTNNMITWESTGSPKAYVKIELVKPGMANHVLISSTPNDGSYDWVIPVTLALGSDYSVKITRTTFPVGGTAATDSSDASFSIFPKGSVNSAILVIHVIDSSGKPIEGVTVWDPLHEYGGGYVKGKGGQTDSNGAWIMAGLDPDSYDITVQKEGLSIMAQYVTLLAGEVQSITFTLYPEARITGTYKYSNGDPVVGMEVDASIASIPFGYCAWTDSSGSFSIGYLPPGDYSMRALKPGTSGNNYDDWVWLPGTYTVVTGQTINDVTIVIP